MKTEIDAIMDRDDAEALKRFRESIFADPVEERKLEALRQMEALEDYWKCLACGED